MSNQLIVLRDVKKTYDNGEVRFEALRGVDLCVEHGEFVAVCGPSGSGKSTLMNIIGCLDTASSGEYLLDGEPIGRMSDDRLSRVRNQRIGFIFQGFNLVDSLDAYENVELPLIYRRLPREQRRSLALAALERVGLASRARHRPGQMSGGQQQRVAIARAIAASPSLILADEPTGNLDTHSGGQVMAILRQLHAEGNTVLLVTHDPRIAREAPRAVQVSDGCIVSDTGTPASFAPAAVARRRAR